MKRLFHVFRRDVFLLLVFGGAFLYSSCSEFIISMKPAVSFENMLDGTKVQAGDKVAGPVIYAFDCFAERSTYTRYEDGSRSGSRKTGKYYLIPVSGGFIGLECREADTAALNKLSAETFQYMEGGAEPSTEVSIQGIVRPMSSGLAGFYNEYLESAGFTEKQIKAMGEPLVIEYISFPAVRVMFVIGLLLMLLGLWILFRRYKRDAEGSGLPKAEDLP